MNCNIVKDLIPLYIDGCCSEESEKAVEEHVSSCAECKRLYEDMKTPCDISEASSSPVKFTKLNDWKASVLQSVTLFLSFALITFGVYLEAYTTSGLTNSLSAFNIVVPATGFMLSLANWYFIRVYKSRKAFSVCSMLITLLLTACGFIWSCFHYDFNVINLFSGVKFSLAGIIDIIEGIVFIFGVGILLTVIFCILSRVLSDKYAKMLGKE
jgi:hypothetical protein